MTYYATRAAALRTAERDASTEHERRAFAAQAAEFEQLGAAVTPPLKGPPLSTITTATAALAPTVHLPMAQWRLINLLYRRPGGTKGWPAQAALRVTDASRDDLIALHDAEMVTAMYEGDRGPVTRIGQANPYEMCLFIADRGKAWATANRHNRVLLTLAEHANSSGVAKLKTVVAAAEVGMEPFYELQESGHIEMRYAESGRRASVAEVKMSQTPSSFRVAMLRKGWTTLAV